MELKKIKAVFIYEGIADQAEDAVLMDGKVFINSGQIGAALYNGIPSDQPDLYIVNLDEDDTDFLAKNPKLLLDLIAG